MKRVIPESTRLQIIVEFKNGSKVGQIAEKLKVHRNTVTNTINRWNRSGTLQYSSPPGRNKKLTNSQVKHLVLNTKRRPTHSFQQLKDETGLQVSL